MAKIKEIIGHKFGKLTVLNTSETRGNRGQIRYDCICDCGNTHTVSGESIRSGKSKSCGCLKKAYIPKTFNPNREHAILKVQYSHLKRRNNKIDSNTKCITFENFYTLSKSKCHYCGLEHSKTLLDRTNETKDTKLISDTIVCVNGIDRVDSSKGYVEDNVVPCCKYCNTAKNTMSRDEFFKWIKRVYEYNY